MYSVGFRYRHIGSINKCPRSKRPVAVSNPGNCERLRKGFKQNDLQSQRQIARTSGISEPTVRRILKNQPDMRMSKYYRGQWLTGPVMCSRGQKCKILLRRNHRAVVFTDEKLFTVKRKFNRQNNRQLLRPGQAPKASDTKSHHGSVTAGAGITATAKTPLVFVDKGVKINAKVYQQRVIRDTMAPFIQKHYQRSPITLQQNWAPAHKAKTSLSLCKNFFAGEVDQV